MIRQHNKLYNQQKRKIRIRSILKSAQSRLRLSTDKSNRYLVSQVIDDKKMRIIFTVSTLGKNMVAAEKHGQQIIEALKKHHIEKLVFDRNGFKFHGVIKKVADVVREGGITI